MTTVQNPAGSGTQTTSVLIRGQTVIGAGLREALLRYLRFSTVGASGVGVDMLLLWALHGTLGIPVVAAKVMAAETAVVTNFLLNDRWTFRDRRRSPQPGLFSRFFRFNLICASGIAFSVALLWAFRHYLGLPVLVSNGIAIVLVSVWNCVLSSRIGWGAGRGGGSRSSR